MPIPDQRVPLDHRAAPEKSGQRVQRDRGDHRVSKAPECARSDQPGRQGHRGKLAILVHLGLPDHLVYLVLLGQLEIRAQPAHKEYSGPRGQRASAGRQGTTLRARAANKERKKTKKQKFDTVYFFSLGLFCARRIGVIDIPPRSTVDRLFAKSQIK
jgi:hypothetical protein